MMSSDSGVDYSKETEEEEGEEEEEEEERLKLGKETEMAKISLMKTLVHRQDHFSKEVDNLTLRRFLRARDLDVEKASAMFLKYLKWRRSFVPNGSISPSEVAREIEQNKMFVQGSDKKGRPVLVFLGARHFQRQGSVEEFKRFIVYAFEKIFSRMPPGQEKFVVNGDLEGWGYANSDIQAYIAAVSLLQDCYPERLGKVFIVHAPYLFTTAWKIVYPFIDNKTRKKIVFVENKTLKSTLLEEIEESQLPEKYGGKLPLIPIRDI